MAAANMYVTVAGAGDKSGDSWANAMGQAEWKTDFEGAVEAGDTYYVEAGTYTEAASDWNGFADGTNLLPISIIGVASGTTNEPPVIGDHPFGTDRPLIAMGTFTFAISQNYWHVYNMRFTASGGSDTLVNGTQRCIHYNCKFIHSGSGDALQGGTGSRAIRCEMSSASGLGVDFNNSEQSLYGCYIHDSATGISIGSFDSFMITNCIIDTCTTGISANTSDTCSITGNTIYNCTDGILVSESTNHHTWTVINNIIDGCTRGWNNSSANVLNNFIDFNVWDNGTDVTNVTKGFNAITGDPGLTDPANGNFRIGSDSNAYNVGLDVGDNTGATA